MSQPWILAGEQFGLWPQSVTLDASLSGATTADLLAAMVNAEVVQEAPRPLIEFKRPSELNERVPLDDGKSSTEWTRAFATAMDALSAPLLNSNQQRRSNERDYEITD